MHEQMSDFSQFIARFHPALVHLPVGFVVLLGALEALAFRPQLKHLSSASRTILALTVPVVFCSAATGWLLARNGDYDPHLLVWHRWTGVSMAVATAFLLVAERCGWQRTYRVGLAVTVVLVAVTGHWGGSLTHGQGYLTRYAPAWLGGGAGSAAAPAGHTAEASLYGTEIQPVFTKYCVSCHGPNKTKAKLRLDSYDGLLAGSENGPVVKAGNSAESVMVQRLKLAPEEEDHMPPEGKRQPTASEVALLAWWIDAGAPRTGTVAELKPPSELLSGKAGAEAPSASSQSQSGGQSPAE